MKNLSRLLYAVAFNLLVMLIIIMYGSEILFTLLNGGSAKTFIENNDNDNNIYLKQFKKHGKWMAGKRHKQTCEFVPELTCSKNKQNLHFEFYKKHLNKVDAVEELRKILKNKKLLLIGDSLMLEFFGGLAELLQVKTTTLNRIINLINTSYSIHPWRNSTITFLRTCTIVSNGTKLLSEEKYFRVTSEEIITKEIADHDIVLFNQGIHYDFKLLLNKGTIYFNNIGQMLHGKGPFTLKS